MSKPQLKLIIPPEISVANALQRIHLWFGDPITLEVPTAGEKSSFHIQIELSIPSELAQLEALRVGEANEIEMDFENLHIVKR